MPSRGSRSVQKNKIWPNGSWWCIFGATMEKTRPHLLLERKLKTAGRQEWGGLVSCYAERPSKKCVLVDGTFLSAVLIIFRQLQLPPFRCILRRYYRETKSLWELIENILFLSSSVLLHSTLQLLYSRPIKYLFHLEWYNSVKEIKTVVCIDCPYFIWSLNSWKMNIVGHIFYWCTASSFAKRIPIGLVHLTLDAMG